MISLAFFVCTTASRRATSVLSLKNYSVILKSVIVVGKLPETFLSSYSLS